MQIKIKNMLSIGMKKFERNTLIQCCLLHCHSKELKGFSDLKSVYWKMCINEKILHENICMPMNLAVNFIYPKYFQVFWYFLPSSQTKSITASD